MGQNIGTGGRAWGNISGRCVEYTAEPLVAPIFRVLLRNRSKWEICSDLAPIFSDLVKHKGYLRKKSEQMILWYIIC